MFPDRLTAAAFAAALSLALSAQGSANDSTAALGTGGLWLTRTDKVAMISEDLAISAERITVKYRFSNTSDGPADYLVAFPLPALDSITPEEMNIILPDPTSPNFVDFTLTVDGAPITPAIDERVTALGVEQTDAVRAAGLPLNPIADGLYQTLQSLPEDIRDNLDRMGLIYVDPYSVQAAWRLETTFYWDQSFPPGKDVTVEHSYRPVVGQFFFGQYNLDDPEFRARYCIDDAFVRAAKAKLAAVGANPGYLSGQHISYILTTARNWAQPIGTFRLVVDKGSEDALVSFCDLADGLRDHRDGLPARSGRAS
jgi:hypothetical protein